MTKVSITSEELLKFEIYKSLLTIGAVGAVLGFVVIYNYYHGIPLINRFLPSLKIEFSGANLR